MSVVDEETMPTNSPLFAHLASCTQCTLRIAELRATRGLLQEAASDAVAPKQDLAARAMGRLRIRRTAIGNLNEVVAAMRALLRGLVDLFGSGPPTDSSASVSPENKGAPRG